MMYNAKLWCHAPYLTPGTSSGEAEAGWAAMGTTAGADTPHVASTRFEGRQAERARRSAEAAFSSMGGEARAARAGREAALVGAQMASTPFLDGYHQRRDGATFDQGGEPVAWPWEQAQGAVGGRRVRAPHAADKMVNAGLDQATARGDRGYNHTGVRAWRSFCEANGEPSDRPLDPNCPLWVKLEEEWLAMRFVCSLIEDRGIEVNTASQYFSSFQGWHAREHGVKLAAGLKLGRLPEMLKGLRRQFGAKPRAIRRGISPRALRLAMDMCLDLEVPAHANIRAALALALQGLLRSAEFALDAGKRWKPAERLTRADVQRCDERMLVVMMHPCKNMHHLAGKTCPLVIGAGGEHIDAVAEMRNLLRVDPVAEGEEGTTPLFRVGGQALSTGMVMDITRQLMAAIGEDPMQFGTHSYRIGGATALFAGGADAMVIRTMGRWSSDLHRLYVRACFEQTLLWSRKAGSAEVSDLAGQFDEVDYY